MKRIIICIMKDPFKPSQTELSKYNRAATVTFHKCGVIDTTWMLQCCLPKWGPGPGQQRFAMYDSATAHVTETVKDAFANQDTSIAGSRWQWTGSGWQ